MQIESAQIDRLLPGGEVEITGVIGGRSWRGVLRPGDALDGLPAETAAAIAQHWSEDAGGGQTRAQLWQAENAPAPPAPVDLVAYAAQKRWQIETGGFLWNGWPVHSDRDSQSKMVAERLAVAEGVRSDPDYWKFADGVFRPLSNAEFTAMSNAVREHIRAVFALEGEALYGIAAGSITTAAQVDAVFA